MNRIRWCAIALATMTFMGANDAQANRISEVVGARANARAGGPISAHDAWILERYGALSGTRYYSRGHYKRRYKRRSKRYWRRRYGY